MRPMSELKKRLLAGILTAAMVFTVVGCGDDSDPSEEDAPQVGS